MTDEEQLWRQFAASCMNCGRIRDVLDGVAIEPWCCATCEPSAEEVTVNSYADREIFNHQEKATWCDAVDMVARVRSTWGNELRCHELARAMAKVLGQLSRQVTLVDGKLWAIEHSWLVMRTLGRHAILDVYCPGRIPQVQLIDAHWSVSRGYEEGPLRDDIKLDIVEKLVWEMHHP